jgi:large subunit ribosomal protein L4
MASVTMKTAEGADAGTVELPDDIFGIEPNVAVMHQVVTAQLAARRAGTHSTKTRSEVRGGGAKPWRQKGTGRARQGSIRAPQWRGGGVAHGPKPRDYSQRTPKKMVRLALLSALSDRASDAKIMVVDDWAIDAPKTKDAVRLLEAVGLRTKPERKEAERKRSRRDKKTQDESAEPTDEAAEPTGEAAEPTAEEAKPTAVETEPRPSRKDPRVLVVLFRDDEATWKSMRNLGERVQIVLPEELNTYDVLVNDWLVFSEASLGTVVARLSGGATDGNGDDEGGDE